MYGTVARLRVKPGMEAEVAAFLRDWARNRRPVVPGAIGGYLYQLDRDPHTMVMAITFADKASYHANAQSPEQDKEYQRMRALLTEDPIWEDGEIVVSY